MGTVLRSQCAVRHQVLRFSPSGGVPTIFAQRNKSEKGANVANTGTNKARYKFSVIAGRPVFRPGRKWSSIPKRKSLPCE